MAGASAEPPTDPSGRPRAARWITTMALVVLSGAVLWALWVPLLLAAWMAVIARPIHEALTRRVGERKRAAGFVTAAFASILVTLLGGLAMAVVLSGLNLYQSLRNSGGFRDAARQLTTSSDLLSSIDWRRGLELVRTYGARAWGAAGSVLGVTGASVVATLVFVLGFYTFLVDGERCWRWCLERAPIPPHDLRRFGRAFAETGRGLLVGIVLTALLQGGVTLAVYLLFSIPQGLVLGLLTIVAALIPTVGTGLVWVPLAVILVVTNHRADALVVTITGLVVGLLDNLVRPLLARFGKLEMPTFLALVAMLAGVATFGAGGLLLGPLVVRLAMEGLDLLRERHEPA